MLNTDINYESLIQKVTSDMFFIWYFDLYQRLQTGTRNNIETKTKGEKTKRTEEKEGITLSVPI